MNLAFHLAVTPRQDNGGDDGLYVTNEPVTESDDFRQPCSVSLHKPALKSVTLLAAEDCSEALS